MNETEKKALVWLASRFHVAPELIKYNHRSSPDFILPDGSGYEVKRLRKNNLTIYSVQWIKLSLLTKCWYLVFRKGNEPEAVIPTSELTIGRSSLYGYNVVLYPY